VLTAPAVWTNPAEGRIWLLVGTSSGLSGLTVDLGPGNVPKLTTRWQNTSNAATSPTVANGLLFAMGGTSIGAFDATTGSSVWSTSTGGTHWQSPIESSGWLVFADNSGHLTAWGL
jgi:outer membrane protein assembly factor BamB